MQPYFLLYADPEMVTKQHAFFSCESEVIAKRLVTLLTKAHSATLEFSMCKPGSDSDEAILWSEAINHIELLSRCEGDFSVFDFTVSPLDRQLVAFFGDCTRWEGIIKAKIKSDRANDDVFYIVRHWFEEGYSGKEPVFRVRGLTLASELVAAANSKYSQVPDGNVLWMGYVETYELVQHEDAPSRLAWDERIKELSQVVTGGNLDGDAEVYAACCDWAISLQRKPSNDDANTSTTQEAAIVATKSATEIGNVAGQPTQQKSKMLPHADANTNTTNQGDIDEPEQPPALTKSERITLAALATFDPSRLASTLDVSEAMPAAERLSERTTRLAIKKLVKLGLAARPEGEKQGARLTISGKRLARQIAD